ncbi:pentapeptide repeat-containing protein [Kitasatospora sp. NPDC052896]|uniref:pentapeptide repeat-containing protein n=1 Tax=Kitasatospora sp. NPDC052896 TaxID=3364061 RepID=UPI0037CBDA1D
MSRQSLVGSTDVPSRLGRLTPTERRVWQAFPHGELVDLRVGDAELDRPAAADRWGTERAVRGEVIAALLLGARVAAAGAVAAVRIAGARITGELSVGHGRTDSQLLLRGCRFDGPITLDEATTGAIDLSGSRLTTLSAYGAQVHGTLDLRDAVVEGGDGTAVHADGIRVEGSLLARGIAVSGTFGLINAVIAGQLALDGAHLANSSPDGKSLNAGGMRVGRSLLASRLVSVGELRLPGAQIGSGLLFDGATLIGPGGRAFDGTSLSVASEASFRINRYKQPDSRPFTAYGTVKLLGARLDGGLNLNGAVLHPTPTAEQAKRAAAAALAGEPEETPQTAPPANDELLFNGSRMLVTGSLHLTYGFRTGGEIRLTGTRITGHLDLGGLASPHALLALYATSAEGGVRDDLADWPERLNLDGFTYGPFSTYLDARKRLPLLARQVHRGRNVGTGGFRAQPYEQLAAYYRSLGNDGEARTVLLAKQRVLRGKLPWRQRIPGHLLDLLVGYGYRPLRAIAWAIGLLVASSAYFSTVKPQRVSAEDQSVFNPVLYAADHLIPIIHFGEADVWQYHGLPEVVTVVLTVLGWTLGLAIAAAASRTFTRN